MKQRAVEPALYSARISAAGGFKNLIKLIFFDDTDPFYSALPVSNLALNRFIQ